MIYKLLNKTFPSLLLLLLRLIRRIRPNNSEKGSYIFLLEFPECYLAYEPIIADLARQELKVSLFIYSEGYIKSFQRKDLNFPVPARVEILDAMPEKCDTLVIHNPYDVDRGRMHSFFNLYHSSRRVCFISYGIEVAGGRTGTHYRLPAMRYSDMVLAPSERIYSNHVKRSGIYLNKKRLIKSQHPYLRQAALQSKDNAPVYDLLYSVHHSVDKTEDLCTFAKYGKTLLEILQREVQLNVLFRPHPLFLSKIESSGYIKTYNDLIELKNVTLSTKNDFLADIVSSKNVITDVSSLVPVIIAARKRLLVLSNNQENMESTQHIHKEYSLSDLKNFLISEMDFEGFKDDTFFNDFSIVDKLCVE